MYRCVLQFVLLCAISLPSPALAREVLILLPLNVDKTLEKEAQLFGTALQQGLSSGFDVFFGPAVEAKLEQEYSKEGCTAQSCAQNLAISFNGELIADSSIQKLDNSFVVQLQINNIITGQIVKSLIEICENCSKLSLIRFIENVGLQATGSPNMRQAAAPSFSPAPAKPVVNLKINSGSVKAEVFINGENLGKAPLTTNRAYSEGQRLDLRLRAPGYQDLRFSHIVGKRDAQLNKLKLEKNPTALYFDSQPRGASIYINSQLMGKTPDEIGAYKDGERLRIRIERDGYKKFSRRHRVGQDDSQLGQITLQSLTSNSEKGEKVRVPMGF
jgi:hypothetical protein